MKNLVVVPVAHGHQKKDVEKFDDFPQSLIRDRLISVAKYFERIFIVVGQKGGSDGIKTTEKYEIHNIGYRFFPFFLFKLFVEMTKMLSNKSKKTILLNFDVHLPGVIASVIARLLGIKVATKYLGFPEQARGFLDKQLLTHKFLLGISDVNVTISPVCKRRLRDLTDAEIRVVPNCVHPSFEERELPEIQDSVLYAGRMDPVKRVDHLIKSFKGVVREKPRAKLFVFGANGGETDLLKQLVDKLDLTKNVEFSSRIPRDDLIDWMNRCQVYVLPSLYEGFGMVLLEAMACGTPVIGMKSGSVPWVVGDAGIIVEPNDAKNLMDSILELFSNKEKREKLSQKGKKKIKNFDQSKWGRNIYEAIIS